ncbi:MAG: hypothetical protein HY043_19785 [Verrucomicrobia bacterium]|nr:hypothetical protein [Verrucomicrobiota bacterium]
MPPRLTCSVCMSGVANRTARGITKESETTDAPVFPATIGKHRVLIIRVDFSDVNGSPIANKSAAVDLFNQSGGVRGFFEQCSYGQLTLAVAESDVTDVLRMPRKSFEYLANRDALHSDAQGAASRLGFDPSSYAHVLVVLKTIGFTDIGRADVGGPRCWIDGVYTVGIVAHEIGHNLGLPHANLWTRPSDDSAWSVGSETEYGDPLDIMGSGYRSGHHFNPWFKYRLGWLSDASVQSITASGRYRVFRFDHPQAKRNDPTHPLALRIARGTREYWIGYRQDTNDTRGIDINGAYVILARSPNAPSLQLNMKTAAEPGPVGYLLPQQTFADPENQLTIRVENRGGNSPDEFLDVSIELVPPIPVAEAVDEPDWTWETDASSGWFGSGVLSHDGHHSARSGFIGDGQRSTLATSITGPGTLTFWWRVSSAPDLDFLGFSLDDRETIRISGSLPWQQRAIDIPEGTHRIAWRYSKSGQPAAGADAGWLDEVVFSNGVVRVGQSIIFDASGSSVTDPFQLRASASSGLPVSYQVLAGPGELAADWLVPGGGGDVVVRATQEGDAHYRPAEPVDHTFTVVVPGGTAWAADLPQMQFANRTNRPPRVLAIAFQSDGKMIVGGDFSHVHGVPRANLARFLANGELDLDWNPGTDGIVNAIVLQDQDIYLGGRFQTVGGVPRSYLAKISTEQGGLVDPEWNPSPSFWVYDLVRNETHLFVAGDFRSVGGTARIYMAKVGLLATGQVALDWQIDSLSTLNLVFHLALSGDRLFLGILYATALHEKPLGLLQVSTESSQGFTRVFPTPRIERGLVNAMTAADGFAYFGGSFDAIDGIPAPYLARVSADDASLVESIGNFSTKNGVEINSVAVVGTNLFAGGRIFDLKPSGAINLARFSTVTRAWDSTWDARANGFVQLIAPKGNDLYVAGDFTGIGGKANSVMALLPTLDGPPTIAPAVTRQGEQTRPSLIIRPHPDDLTETTHFDIRGIAGGRLFKNDGFTPITNRSFITVAEGMAGLRFTPSPGFVGVASFRARSALRNDASIPSGPRTSAVIFVLPENAELFAIAIGSKVKLIWPLSTRTLRLEKSKDVVSGVWVPVLEAPLRIDDFGTMDVDLSEDRQFFRIHAIDSSKP